MRPGQRARTGGGDEPIGGLGARARRRAVARGHLAALFGRGARQVGGVGPQGELDAGDDKEEEDGEADDEVGEAFFASPSALRPCALRCLSQRGDG